MGILGFLKKKEELPLPPPPIPPSMPPSDIPTIKPQEVFEPPQLIESPEPIDRQPITLQPELPSYKEEPQVEEASQVEPKSEPPQSIFISIDDYKAIVNHANIIQSRISEAQTVLKNLEELNTQEEKERQRWQTHLEQLEKKFAYVDKILANG